MTASRQRPDVPYTNLQGLFVAASGDEFWLNSQPGWDLVVTGIDSVVNDAFPGDQYLIEFAMKIGGFSPLPFFSAIGTGALTTGFSWWQWRGAMVLELGQSVHVIWDDGALNDLVVSFMVQGYWTPHVIVP